MTHPEPQSTGHVPPETADQSHPNVPIHLLQPREKKKRSSSRSKKMYRAVTSAFRSFPILTPACRFPVALPGFGGSHDGNVHGSKVTGTLFGHRKARISLAVQDNPRSLPMLVLELPIPSGKLLQEMGTGLVRLALESEKKAADKTKLLDEPAWTMYCNGRKMGYGTKREPLDTDLTVMQLLSAASMGAGVLPSSSTKETADGELTYMRAFFDRVVGSKDSETFYMMNPDGSGGPELSIFFVRI